MTSTTFSPEAMTASEIAALMKQLRDVQKTARDAENARYAEAARPFIETVLAEHTVEPSEFSERVGYSTQNLTIEVEGVTYTFYVAIKDVEASKKRKTAIDAGEVTLKKRETKKKPAESKPEDKSEGDSEGDSEE